MMCTASAATSAGPTTRRRRTPSFLIRLDRQNKGLPGMGTTLNRRDATSFLTVAELFSSTDLCQAEHPNMWQVAGSAVWHYRSAYVPRCFTVAGAAAFVPSSSAPPVPSPLAFAAEQAWPVAAGQVAA